MRYPNTILFDASTSKRINRSELPNAATFYSKEFPGIKIKPQWINVKCCFHTDSNPSLGLNLLSGGFYCFACGAKGSDIISFIMQRYHLGFKAACLQLGVNL